MLDAALLMSTSTLPNIFSAVLIIVRDFGGLGHVGRRIVCLDQEFVFDRGAFLLGRGRVAKALIITLAPSRASARAMASPMPEVEPVTTAVFPFSMADLLMVLFRRSHSTQLCCGGRSHEMRSEKVRRTFGFDFARIWLGMVDYVATGILHAMYAYCAAISPVYLANTI